MSQVPTETPPSQYYCDRCKITYTPKCRPCTAGKIVIHCPACGGSAVQVTRG
jgi:hypothetical protein